MDAFKQKAFDEMDAFKQKAKDVFTTEGALGAAATAALVAGAAMGVYFLWPAGVAVGATMKAPGATGFVISRAAFVANPQLYFQMLRTVGAAAAFAL
ncbi:hypothetical protein ZWY2020_042178 [Hordeum vulgare]|nr:hypothetical protein ZWY2020_042178 [Hordeum vulgare]